MSTTLQIDQMTLEEKLQAMEELWDDLCQREEDVPVPQWQRELLEERERLIERGSAQFADSEIVRSVSPSEPQLDRGCLYEAQMADKLFDSEPENS